MLLSEVLAIMETFHHPGIEFFAECTPLCNRFLFIQIRATIPNVNPLVQAETVQITVSHALPASLVTKDNLPDLMYEILCHWQRHEVGHMFTVNGVDRFNDHIHTEHQKTSKAIFDARVAVILFRKEIG